MCGCNGQNRPAVRVQSSPPSQQLNGLVGNAANERTQKLIELLKAHSHKR